MSRKQRNIELTKKHLKRGVTGTPQLALLVGVANRTMAGYLQELGIGDRHPLAKDVKARHEFILKHWDRPANWFAQECNRSLNVIYRDIREIEKVTGKSYWRRDGKNTTSSTFALSERYQYEHAARVHNLFLTVNGVKS